MYSSCNHINTKTTDFTACLFRLANTNKDSIVCIEIAQVKSGKISHKQHWIINPESDFDPNNQAQREFLTHKDVENKPSFAKVWPEIKPYFGNQIIITQNPSHVLNMLFYTLDRFELPYPDIIFYDSKNIIGRALLTEISEAETEMIQFYRNQGVAYKHSEIDAPYDPMLFAEKLGLRYEYGLGNFAVVIAEAMQKVFEVTGFDSFDCLEQELGCKHGYTQKKDYRSYQAHSNLKHEIDYKKIQKQALDNNIIKCVYTGRRILFTGKMKNLTREEIVQLAAKFGIIPQERITKTLNIVVVGEKPGESKIEMIEKINSEGGCIITMDEERFLQSIQNISKNNEA